MVDLLQPLVVTPQACPFVALDGDREQRLPVPDPMHRCFAEATPKARSMGHQASFCLTAAFTGCPIFLDWASRVAADLVETVPAGAGASAGAGTSSGSAAGGASTAAANGTATVSNPTATAPAAPASVTTETRPATASSWVAEAMPPPADSMDVASRRTARVVIDTGPGPGPGMAPSTDVTMVATAAMVTPYPQSPAAPPTSAAPPAPDEPWPMDPDSDAAAELAASMARTDLMVDGDASSGAEPGASTASDEDGTDSPPWSRGRPRVRVDAGAPSSLGPQTRPGAKPSGPREWEGTRRFEAYAARTGSRRPGRPVLIAIGAVLVAVALLIVFLLPSMFRGGAAAPTAEPSSPANGLTATARPRSTAKAPGATPRGPERTPGSYKVKRGDTLSSIGRKFNVTVEQLICANSIRNPNSVSTGTTLVIPSESYKCPKPTKKPKKTPTG